MFAIKPFLNPRENFVFARLNEKLRKIKKNNLKILQTFPSSVISGFNSKGFHFGFYLINIFIGQIAEQ